jgi:nucleotide-binding universal stress UspA family protein
MSAQRVLVGINGSPQSAAALFWASDQEAPVESELWVVYVYEQETGHPRSASRTTAREGHARACASQWVDSAIRAKTGRRKVRLEVVEGVPGPALTLRSHQADALILGAPGGHTPADAPWGPVAAHCIATAACRVICVPPGLVECVRGCSP